MLFKEQIVPASRTYLQVYAFLQSLQYGSPKFGLFISEHAQLFRARHGL